MQISKAWPHYACLALACLLLLGCGAQDAPDASTTEEAAAEGEKSKFIADDFEPPVSTEADGFVLRPLGPDVMEIDYKAYMSSIEHLQKTFTRSDR